MMLANGPKGGESRQVVVSGDFNNYSSEFVIGLEDVIAAAREFCINGSLAERFKWEKQT